MAKTIFFWAMVILAVVNYFTAVALWPIISADGIDEGDIALTVALTTPFFTGVAAFGLYPLIVWWRSSRQR